MKKVLLPFELFLSYFCWGREVERAIGQLVACVIIQGLSVGVKLVALYKYRKLPVSPVIFDTFCTNSTTRSLDMGMDGYECH